MEPAPEENASTPPVVLERKKSVKPKSPPKKPVVAREGSSGEAVPGSPGSVSPPPALSPDLLKKESTSPGRVSPTPIENVTAREKKERVTLKTSSVSPSLPSGDATKTSIGTIDGPPPSQSEAVSVVSASGGSVIPPPIAVESILAGTYDIVIPDVGKLSVSADEVGVVGVSTPEEIQTPVIAKRSFIMKDWSYNCEMNMSVDLLLNMQRRLDRIEEFFDMKSKWNDEKTSDTRVFQMQFTTPFFKNPGTIEQSRARQTQEQLRITEIGSLLGVDSYREHVISMNDDSSNNFRNRMKQIRKSLDSDFNPDWAEQVLSHVYQCPTLLDRITYLGKLIRKLFRGNVGGAENRLRALHVPINAEEGPIGLSNALSAIIGKRTYILENMHLVSFIATQCRQLQEAKQALESSSMYIQDQSSWTSMTDRLEKLSQKCIIYSDRVCLLEKRLTDITTRYIQMSNIFYMLLSLKSVPAQ